MNTATAMGAVLLGLNVQQLEVRAIVHESFKGVQIRGIPEAPATELKSVIASNFPRTPMCIDVPTFEGSGSVNWGALDLAVFAAIMRAQGHRFASAATLFVGEVALDGTVRRTRGAACYATAGEIVVGKESAEEARQTAGAYVHAIERFGELASLNGYSRDELSPALQVVLVEVLAHPRTLLVGPPGVGKTMVARRAVERIAPVDLPTVQKIWSASGLGPFQGVIQPFRAPHHTVSESGLIGAKGRPGEVSLAHAGVLMLDEVADFSSVAINSLEYVLERGVAHMGIPAAPARIIAASNLCPCGWSGSNRACVDQRGSVESYRSALDRIAKKLKLHIIEMKHEG